MKAGISRLGAVATAAAMASVAVFGTGGSAFASPTVPIFPWSPLVMTGHCPVVNPSAASLTADGSSFQNIGVQDEITAYVGGSKCGAGHTSAGITYTATGSGTCIAQITGHTKGINFCGTDVPYADADFETTLTNGTPIQTIPIALGSVGFGYNSPGGCLANHADVSGETIAKIYLGLITTWGGVSNTCTGANASVTIKVLTRSTGSGTTAAFKAYLYHSDIQANPTTAAAPRFPAPPSKGSFGAPATGTCPDGVTGSLTTNQLMAACLASAGSVGSVGYLDESDDINSGPIPVAQVDNAAGLFLAPGKSVSGALGGCEEAALTGVTPPSTLLPWSHVDITRSLLGYGICTYTYQLAFEFADNVGFPGGAGVSTVAQAAQTRAFIAFELSDDGQAIFVHDHYEALPLLVQAIGLAGNLTLSCLNIATQNVLC
jgi:ABC-type phosphate transport system substrate-binding protein